MQNNVLKITGTLVGSSLDATWVRGTTSPDLTYDIDLGFDIPRALIFAFGDTQTLAKHSSVVVIPKITLVRTQVCSAGCLTCSGPDSSNCISNAPVTNPNPAPTNNTTVP